MLHVTQCIAFPVRSKPGRPLSFQRAVVQYMRNVKKQTGISIYVSEEQAQWHSRCVGALRLAYPSRQCLQ